MNHAAHPLAVLFLSAGAAATAGIQFTVTADGTARYQGVPLQSGMQSVTNPPVAPGDVVNLSLLSDPASDGFSFARSDSRFGFDALGGYSRNFARASGFAPSFGPPNEVFAASNTSATLSYRVTSPTTPVGTAIQVRTVLHYSGQLGTSNYFGNAGVGGLTATFASSFTIGGVSFFDASATLEQQFPAGVMPPVLTTSGPWGGAWVFSVEQNPLGDYNAYTLSFADVVNYNTVMASDFDVVFTQSASAQIPGPFEAFAAADFTNTGRFAFEVYDENGVLIPDAAVTLIPAPGTTALGAGLLALAGGRRRPRFAFRV